MAYIRDKRTELTGAQDIAEFRPANNLQYDFVMVYGLDNTTARRIDEYRAKGYVVHLMTGVSWGDYKDYLKGQWDGREHWDESQTQRSGDAVAHGPEVPYMVPTISFTDYLTEKLKIAIDAGVEAIHLEEPEYWSFGGYAEAFKREYLLYYKKPWEEFHKDVDSVYSGSQLMAYLYTRAVDRICSSLREYALIKYNKMVRFYVATHSLLSYCQIRMVSPESKLMEIPSVDGYIAQIWTGTSRMPSEYNGQSKERTFETGFFEYGIMQELVKGTDRRMWYLHDPVEDNPRHDWADYEYNYIKTVAASLYQPHIWHYEIAPWPHRVFEGNYPQLSPGEVKELQEKAGDNAVIELEQPIPPHYATKLCNMMNMLGDMDQPIARVNDLDYNVGVLMADSCMFQRQVPDSCTGENDPKGYNERGCGTSLPDFMGVALPLLKHGLPVRPVQMDNINRYSSYLDDYQVLVLTYEFFKPDSPGLHTALANWISDGGVLIYVGDGSDPFHKVNSWWNRDGRYENPGQHLMETLGLGKTPDDGLYPRGEGFVSVLNRRPLTLTENEEGAQLMRNTVETAMAKKGYVWNHTNAMIIRRGPYLVVSCMDESITSESYREQGHFVEMTETDLPIVREVVVQPNENKIFFDLSKITEDTRIIGTSLRIHSLDTDDNGFVMECEGPDRIHAVMRIRFARPVTALETVVLEDSTPVDTAWEWDSDSRTVVIRLHSDGRRLKMTGRF